MTQVCAGVTRTWVDLLHFRLRCAPEPHTWDSRSALEGCGIEVGGRRCVIVSHTCVVFGIIRLRYALGRYVPGLFSRLFVSGVRCYVSHLRCFTYVSLQVRNRDSRDGRFLVPLFLARGA